MPIGKNSFHKTSFFLIVAFLVLYIYCQSPGLTGGDAGDLVPVAALRGIAHPPGYPLYIFLGWVLTKLPLGPSPAFKVGLLSSIPSAFAVFLTYLFALRLTKKPFLAIFSSLSLGFNYLFWQQAVVQEVFALHGFFLFLTLYLVLQWLEKKDIKIVYFLAFITGLEFAHHHTYVLIIPALIYLFLVNPKTKIKKKWLASKLVLTILVCFFIGASFYLYLFWASRQRVSVSWKQITDLHDLFRHITRKDYGTFAPTAGQKFSFERGILAVIAFLNFVYQEFTFFGLIFILLGLRALFIRKKTIFYFSMIWFVFAGLFFQFYAGFPISGWYSLGTVERFYILVFPVFLLWLTFGLDCVWLKAEKFSPPLGKITVVFLYSFYLGFLFWINFPKNNLHNFNEFDHFGKRLLESCPPGSVLLLKGDLPFFPASYAHFVRGKRQDLILVSLGHPSRAIFYYQEFAQLRSFYDQPRQARTREKFLIVLGKYLDQKELSICSSDEVALGPQYKFYPSDLAVVYVKKEKASFNYQKIFEANRGIWEKKSRVSDWVVDPRFDNFFFQSLLRFYSDRCLAMSNFFFAAEEYKKAEFWLDRAWQYDPDSKAAFRLAFLIDVVQKNCQEAEKKLENKPAVLKTSEIWPVVNKIYQEECLNLKK